MRRIELLLGKSAADKDSDLDEVQVTRLAHLLRSQGGEHGAALAAKLLEQESDGPAADAAPADKAADTVID